MPRTTRNPIVVTRSGVNAGLTAADNANGEQFANNGKSILHVKNTGGGACTVSISFARQIDGVTPAAKTVTVPATTGEKYIGIFPPGDYNQVGDLVYVDYSTGTGVTAEVISHE
jgi:hypothetical protein